MVLFSLEQAQIALSVSLRNEKHSDFNSFSNSSHSIMTKETGSNGFDIYVNEYNR